MPHRCRETLSGEYLAVECALSRNCSSYTGLFVIRMLQNITMECSNDFFVMRLEDGTGALERVVPLSSFTNVEELVIASIKYPPHLPSSRSMPLASVKRLNVVIHCLHKSCNYSVLRLVILREMQNILPNIENLLVEWRVGEGLSAPLPGEDPLMMGHGVIADLEAHLHVLDDIAKTLRYPGTYNIEARLSNLASPHKHKGLSFDLSGTLSFDSSHPLVMSSNRQRRLSFQYGGIFLFDAVSLTVVSHLF